MSKDRVSIKGVLVVALLLAALVGCTAIQAAPKSDLQSGSPSTQVTVQRTITVVGVGKVSLVPDIAQLNVGAEDTANTVAEAKAKVDGQMAAIMAALKEMGIADKDIQTSNYSIYYEQQASPSSEGSSSAERRGVYHVSNTLLITVRDVTKAGDVLDTLVGVGANQVYGVSFTVSDEVKWQSQAREKAITDAKARAEELARLSGVEVGQVQAISEVIGSVSYPVAAERGLGGGSAIVPGEQELSMQVQVTYAMQ
jgi:uncharacterized protein YggE